MNCGLQFLSKEKCIAVTVGNLGTRALSDTKCKVVGIDCVQIIGQMGLSFSGLNCLRVDCGLLDQYVLCCLSNNTNGPVQLLDLELIV